MPTQILENRFEIESQLSCTDFSTVYLGCDRRYPHRPPCLITAIPYHQREIRHRLEREAQLLERLGRHPQIPRVLAFFHKADTSADEPEPLGTFYLIQDHIAGHPLSEEIKPPKPLSESYVNKLIKDVLIALTFAHEQGLVHQNLHPQHLIREARDGQIFVTQFGEFSKIARSKVAADGSLGSSVPVGPSAYSAPEQLKALSNGSFKAPPATDLYALGLIAIEALTGQRHHNFAYEAQVGLKWRDQAPVSIHLGEFIDRLVRQDWCDRFPNAKEALETFKAQNARTQVANDSRMPTVVAAPGKKTGTTLTTRGVSKTRLTSRSAGQLANPYLPKLMIGSLATVLALGIGVKTYQWGEYRLSQFPIDFQRFDFQRFRLPNRTYTAADRKDLVPLLADGSILLQPAAANAFWQMFAAAMAEDIQLFPLAGYSYENNADTNYKTGYALDIGGQKNEQDQQREFANSEEFKWLRQNAQQYGFELSLEKDRQLGSFFSEPWHWRYVGDEASQKVFGL